MTTMMDMACTDCHYDPSEEREEGEVEEHKEKRGKESTVITGCGDN